MTLRQLRVLVQHLPPRGALYRAVHGHSWHDTEYLLAQILDDIRVIPTAVFRAAGGKAKAPKPIRRPGDKPQQQVGDRAGQSTEAVLAYLDTVSARGSE